MVLPLMWKSAVVRSSRALVQSQVLPHRSVVVARGYHDTIVEHYENPRNVGSLDKNDASVGTVRRSSSPLWSLPAVTIPAAVAGSSSFCLGLFRGWDQMIESRLKQRGTPGQDCSLFCHCTITARLTPRNSLHQVLTLVFFLHVICLFQNSFVFCRVWSVPPRVEM